MAKRKAPAPPVAQKPDISGQPASSAVDEGPDSDAGLSPKEVVFVEELAKGSPSCQAARVAGISERTARRWRQRPEILAATRARVNDSLATARAILAQGSATAARQLVELCENAEPDAARVAACRSVLEAASDGCQIEDLAAALSELEARLATTGRRRHP